MQPADLSCASMGSMSQLVWQTLEMPILAINAGSSSIRFALFDAGAPPARVRGGKIDRIGHRRCGALRHRARRGRDADARSRWTAASFPSAVDGLLKWLQSQDWLGEVEAVGHRVVHGMSHTAPQRATGELLEELKRLGALDPEHIPQEIQLIEAFREKLPHLPQVLCFDTAFHRDMPRRSTLLPIPRRYDAAGIRRYGFHGLSYTYLMQELARLRDPSAARGRVILAHLGSGASLAAVRDGHCIDTTMGFTPTGGLMMGTRPGDLDPGVLFSSRRQREHGCGGAPAHAQSRIRAHGSLRDQRRHPRSVETRSRGCARGGGDRFILLSREESHRVVRGRAGRPRYAGICRRHRRELARYSRADLRRISRSSASD